MSVGLICDECGAASPDFHLPVRYANGEATVEVSVVKGRGSLDLCRRCYCNMLVVFAVNAAPPGVTIEWKEKAWIVAPKPEPAVTP